MGQALTLIYYNSQLSNTAEAEELYQIYDLNYKMFLNPDTVLVFEDL